MSQPTFSYQIKLLEEEVGFEIFVRNGKGATLTPAGQQFVTYLSNMREEMKRAHLLQLIMQKISSFESFY